MSCPVPIFSSRYHVPSCPVDTVKNHESARVYCQISLCLSEITSGTMSLAARYIIPQRLSLFYITIIAPSEGLWGLLIHLTRKYRGDIKVHLTPPFILRPFLMQPKIANFWIRIVLVWQHTRPRPPTAHTATHTVV